MCDDNEDDDDNDDDSSFDREILEARVYEANTADEITERALPQKEVLVTELSCGSTHFFTSTLVSTCAATTSLNTSRFDLRFPTPSEPTLKYWYP